MKNLINGTDFINLCKKNTLGGGYLFFDDEEYMKLHCLGLAKKTLLDPDMADFNYQKINCEDDKEWLSSLKDALETPPVFAERKLIIVDELKLRSAQEGDEDFFTLLAELENYPECTVIFSLGKDFDFGRLPKAPSSQYKKLAAHLTPVRFERESPARLNTWVAKRFAANGILCDGVTAKYMVDFVSPDMSCLASECEKLICYLKSLGENKVTEMLINKVCVPSKIEGEFDLSNALLEGDLIRCLELVYSMKRRKERPEMIYTQVSSYVLNMYLVKVLHDEGDSKSEISKKSGIHEYRVGMYLSAIEKRRISAKRLGNLTEKCSEADKRIKSTSLDSYAVLEKLIYEVCS